MRRKITDRTKALVIINPNNPTGALFIRERGVCQKIVDLAREHHLIIFSDEIYDRLLLWTERTYFHCFTGTGSVLRHLQRSFQIHMIAGFRIG